jgi:hypothetical protein
MPIRSLAAAVAAATMATITLIAPATEAADACLDQVRDLASQRGVSSAPPVAAPGKGEVTPQDLARSGGVIKPPPMDDKGVIKPPADKQSAMPTIPDVAPTPKEEPAADRTRLQAALTAARDRAEQGDEKGCQEALARARTLDERTN